MSKVKETVSIKFKVPVESYLKFKRICDEQCMPINDFFRQKLVEVLLSFGKVPEIVQPQEEQPPEVPDMVVQGFKHEDQDPDSGCCGKDCKKKHVNSCRLRRNYRS